VTLAPWPASFHRRGGRAFVRSAAGRQLFAQGLRWDKPVKLSTGGMEWFTRSAPPLEQARLTLQHGGPVVGRVDWWRADVLGLDAVLSVHESPGGGWSAGVARQARLAAAIAGVPRH
jgi:hypothetical protein